MLRSIRTQIIVASSLLIILMLAATTYFVIDQKVKEINFNIFQNAISFAELTAERVITNYENNYLEQAYAHFDRELAEIQSLNEDILGIEIYSYQGSVLYSPFKNDRNLQDEMLERLQAFHPSVKVKGSGRIIYLEKANDQIIYANVNGREVAPLQNNEQIEDIIYPFRDSNNSLRSFSIRYPVYYGYLENRIKDTVKNSVVLALFGIAISLFMGGIIASRITSPLKVLSGGARAFGQGDLSHRIEVKTRSEIGELANTFNQMARDLEKNTKELVLKERQTKELELAGQIQKDILPKVIPQPKNLEIAASMIPAAEVGGDCYDFIPIDDDKLLFYIADVTGHGVSAGIVSAISNALVPAFLEQVKNTSELVIHMNRILKMKTQPNVFITFLVGVWSTKEANLFYTQAGHDPILHYSQGEVKQLATGGMALGMVQDISKITKREKVDSRPGDVFVLYTDGIPEAWKNDKEQMGMPRFKEILKKYGHLPTAQQIHDAIIKEVRAYMGNHPQEDDITLIVAKRTK